MENVINPSIVHLVHKVCQGKYDHLHKERGRNQVDPGAKSKMRWVYALALSALLLVSASASAQVKLTVGHWTAGLEMEIIDAIVQEFQKRNPHIEVELVPTHGGPWGRDKYVTMFTGGAAPDLLLLNSGNFEMFAARGWLLPLDRLPKAIRTFISTNSCPR